ncbi:MAG: hypothetical protein WBA39_31250, partial [Rivularia sp. (in: cyanobacteria)]
LISSEQDARTTLYSLIPNYQLPITNYRCPIINYQLPITNYQSPIPNPQSPIPNQPNCNLAVSYF